MPANIIHQVTDWQCLWSLHRTTSVNHCRPGCRICLEQLCEAGLSYYSSLSRFITIHPIVVENQKAPWINESSHKPQLRRSPWWDQGSVGDTEKFIVSSMMVLWDGALTFRFHCVVWMLSCSLLIPCSVFLRMLLFNTTGFCVQPCNIQLYFTVHSCMVQWQQNWICWWSYIS